MADDTDKTRVTILTRTYRIKGCIDLVPGARVTDYMNEAKSFLAVTGAEVCDISGRQLFAAPFLDVNRDHVEIIVPGSH
jgi:hypothetical protein